MGSGAYFYRLLGTPVAERYRAEISLGPPQARTVFTVLLVEANRLVSCDRLAEELWGNTPPASARVQIQGLISRLRRSLRSPAGEQPILTEGAGYLLRVRAGESDVEQFDDLVGQGRTLLSEARYDVASQRLRDALGLWRGPALSGVSLTTATGAAAQWEDLRLAALEDYIEAEMGLGEHDRLVPELRELITAHPFRERPRGQLMTALARAGRTAEALQTYRDWRRWLADELGVEPSPGIGALHADILRAEPGVRPAGHQVYRQQGVPCQLPPDVTDFVGRAALTAELLDELTSHRGRNAPPVLLLTGAGGIGKSSLAVRLGHEVRDAYPDGQLFAGLRGTVDPRSSEAVLAGFLRALGVPSDMIPTDLEECACLFRSVLHGRRVLVVLDDAADEKQIRPLVPAEPGCAVIVTSRSSLAGLELGRSAPLDVLSKDDASALLCRLIGRAEIAEDSRAADEVLEYCGGWPLAIRIVGSRLADRSRWELADVAKALSVERRRLDWLQAGDLAVRSSLSLSYRQLDVDRQMLFRRLGLMPAVDFPEWVAAALMNGELVVAERLLEDLHRRHMVHFVGRGAGRPRYRVHDLLRSFALEAVAGEPETERAESTERALGGWLWLAEQAADRLPGSVLRPGRGEATRWPIDTAVADVLVMDPLAWFQAEHPALEGAVSHAADAGLAELAWELAVVSACYFDHRGLYTEWSRCHHRALAAVRTAGCVRGEAALLRGIGQLHLYRDDYSEATNALNESRRICERIGDRPGVARALTGLGAACRATGRPGDARTLALRALAIFTECGDALGMAHMYTSIAVACIHQGQLDEAEASLDRARWLCVELDDDHRMALVLRRYGQLQLELADPRRAMGYLRRALDLLESLRDEQCAAQVRLDIGRAHTMLGERHAATKVLIGASSQFTDVGNRSSAAACARLLGTLVS